MVQVCIVGGGPRGLMLLERICANALVATRDGGTVEVHVVDPYPPGPGRVWRTAQSSDLLMNTVASQVTVFTDETVIMSGRFVRGPSLYNWARFHVFISEPDDADYSEMRSLDANSYPSRSLYGRYLEWAFQHVVATAPDGITVRVHRALAIRIQDDPSGTQTLTLDDGTEIGQLDAVVLAQGHLPVRPSDEEDRLTAYAAEHDLRYVAPTNPADADLTGITPGVAVGLRGLGLCFFDYMALFTSGRGGRFHRVPGGGLRYEPSGAEPRLIAGSRRGVPYHARGENQKGPYGRHNPVFLTMDVIERLRAAAVAQGGLNFRRDLWPMIALEVEHVYYTALLGDAFAARYAACAGDPGELLDEFAVPQSDRWDWARISQPMPRDGYRDPADFTAHLLHYLADDVRHAYAGNVNGPLKAALDVLRDLRNEVRLLIDHGGLTGASYASDVEAWYSPLNAFLSIGPPVRRVEEMIALIEAGVLEIVGPDLALSTDAGAFVLASPGVPGSQRSVSVLVEARLPEISLQRTADPLLRFLLETGAADHYQLRNPQAPSYRTQGIAITGRPFRIVDAAGRAASAAVRVRRTDRGRALGHRRRRPAGREFGGARRRGRDFAGRTRAAAGHGGCIDPPDPGCSDACRGRSHPCPTPFVTPGCSPRSGPAPPSRRPSRTRPGWPRCSRPNRRWPARRRGSGWSRHAHAATITTVAQTEIFDPVRIARRAREQANPVVALVDELTAAVARVDADAASYVHRGSTSQDVFDTGLMLVARTAIGLILADLDRVTAALAGLAARHRDTPMPGRTLTQHAVPITFGLKAAGWLVAVAQVRERLAAVPLYAQLGGAAGTLAGYVEYARLDGIDVSAYATDLLREYAIEVGLREPVLPWHTARLPIADIATTSALVTGVLGKIAADVQCARPYRDRRGRRADRGRPGCLIGDAAQAQSGARHADPIGLDAGPALRCGGPGDHAVRGRAGRRPVAGGVAAAAGMPAPDRRRRGCGGRTRRGPDRTPGPDGRRISRSSASWWHRSGSRRCWRRCSARRRRGRSSPSCAGDRSTRAVRWPSCSPPRASCRPTRSPTCSIRCSTPAWRRCWSTARCPPSRRDAASPAGERHRDAAVVGRCGAGGIRGRRTAVGVREQPEQVRGCRVVVHGSGVPGIVERDDITVERDVHVRVRHDLPRHRRARVGVAERAVRRGRCRTRGAAVQRTVHRCLDQAGSPGCERRRRE